MTIVPTTADVTTAVVPVTVEIDADSFVHLIPDEAMVKREPGFSPAADDCEFFEARQQGDPRPRVA